MSSRSTSASSSPAPCAPPPPARVFHTLATKPPQDPQSLLAYCRECCKTIVSGTVYISAGVHVPPWPMSAALANTAVHTSTHPFPTLCHLGSLTSTQTLKCTCHCRPCCSKSCTAPRSLPSKSLTDMHASGQSGIRHNNSSRLPWSKYYPKQIEY